MGANGNASDFSTTEADGISHGGGGLCMYIRGSFRGLRQIFPRKIPWESTAQYLHRRRLGSSPGRKRSSSSEVHLLPPTIILCTTIYFGILWQRHFLLLYLPASMENAAASVDVAAATMDDLRQRLRGIGSFAGACESDSQEWLSHFPGPRALLTFCSATCTAYVDDIEVFGPLRQLRARVAGPSEVPAEFLPAARHDNVCEITWRRSEYDQRGAQCAE